MALTPDTPDEPNQAFLREVDENLRRDQLQSFAKTYGKWLIAALILFLAAVGGYLYWQQKQIEKSQAQSEELTKIYEQIGSGGAEGAKTRLKPLEDSGNDVVRAVALMADAAIALDSGDRATALGKYRAIVNDKGIPDPYRDAATIRSTALEFDTLKPEEVIARLEPLAKPGNAWFGTAGEMTAMAYLKQGQKDKAGRLFAAIATNLEVPETLRNRAQQIAGTLGIDITAAAPPASQPGTSE
ncbi:tetratricopeptide repeat protein [Sphingomonas sp. RG327]|uniref:Tetratricopeptide repeat protein n=1 Tax=Sphingomonas anseongensis TaxID=2908207 RepID=A0ABT0RI23_9SPHN|nr:tetratricopeptide repeat protein [Sphingomonas anseongensis]MCL6679901.1 tetratricopeptide repeat protein [Sphingomonas anseongensis]